MSRSTRNVFEAVRKNSQHVFMGFKTLVYALCFKCIIDQFQYNKIQPEAIDLSTGITTEFVGFIPQSVVLRFIVLA